MIASTYAPLQHLCRIQVVIKDLWVFLRQSFSPLRHQQQWVWGQSLGGDVKLVRTMHWLNATRFVDCGIICFVSKVKHSRIQGFPSSLAHMSFSPGYSLFDVVIFLMCSLIILPARAATSKSFSVCGQFLSSRRITPLKLFKQTMSPSIPLPEKYICSPYLSFSFKRKALFE